MHVASIVITLVAAAANGYAACLNFAGAESVTAVADRLDVSRRWMIPLGTLLALGAAGLVIGFAVAPLGRAAASGLVLYFVCALAVHIRARDRQVGGAIGFLVLAIAALVANAAYHDQWR